MMRTLTAVSGGWAGTDPWFSPTMAWASSVAAFDAGAPSGPRMKSRSAALGATLSPARSGGGSTHAYGVGGANPSNRGSTGRDDSCAVTAATTTYSRARPAPAHAAGRVTGLPSDESSPVSACQTGLPGRSLAYPLTRAVQ